MSRRCLNRSVWLTLLIIWCYSVTTWTQAQSHFKHLTDVWPNVSWTNGGKHTTFKPSKHITLVCPVSPQRSLTGCSNICIKCSCTQQTTKFVNLMSKLANIYSISQGDHLYGCNADKKSYNCNLRCVCLEASSCPTFVWLPFDINNVFMWSL